MKNTKRYFLKNASVVCTIDGHARQVIPGAELFPSQMDKAELNAMKKGDLISVQSADENLGKSKEVEGKKTPDVTTSGKADMAVAVSMTALEGRDLDALNILCVERGLDASEVFDNEADAKEYLTKNA